MKEFTKALALCACLGFALSLHNNDEPSYMSCEEGCVTTSNSNACMRGCTFYTLIKLKSHLGFIEPPVLVGAPGAISSIPINCYQSCVEAYNETTDEKDACRIGCDVQQRLDNTFKHEKEKTQDGYDYENLQPMFQIMKVSERAVGAMRVFVRSMTMFFMKEDDQTVVAIEQPPVIRVMIGLPESVYAPVSSNDLPEVVDPTPETFYRNTEAGNQAFRRSDPFNNPEFQEVTAVKDVPPMSMTVKYAVTTGLAVMISVCLALIMCMTVSIISHRFASKKDMPSSAMRPTFNPGSKEAPMLVKVIRTEDLTKLSIMEEDEKFAIKVPESSVI